MPKKTINDYTFYKIINVNCDVDLCYVGSTVNMKERVRDHKKHCHNPNMRLYNLKVYKTIREYGGWDEFKIIEIGYAKQLTLTEARVIEERYRVELCAELNDRRCHITEEGKKQRDKLNVRNLYEKNKDKIQTRDRAKITCECGCIICHGNKLHRKTKKHIDLMNNKNNIEVIHNE